MADTPIPARLAHRPTQGGLVVPWIAVQLADGTHDFAACVGRQVNLAMLDQLCQVCGDPIPPPIVFFAAADQLDDMLLDAPPLHPECAAYSAQACPMVAGHLATYRRHASRASTNRQPCAEPGCDCGGWVATEERERGATALAWSAVWCRSYDRIAPSREAVVALRAGYAVPGLRIMARPNPVLRIRPVARTAPS
jgi:hypothetical protein